MVPPWIVVLKFFFLNPHRVSDVPGFWSYVFDVASLGVKMCKVLSAARSMVVHVGHRFLQAETRIPAAPRRTQLTLQNAEARLVGSGWRLGPKRVVLSWLPSGKLT